MNKPIIVIGAGIAGLSCAVKLQEAGFSVAIVAAAPSAGTTSAAAAAIWFPFHAGAHPRTAHWARATYDDCRIKANDPDSFIAFADLTIRARGAPVPMQAEIQALPGFRTLAPDELPARCPSGYTVPVPLMWSDRLLPRLLETFTASGGTLTIRTVIDLVTEARTAGVIVNCTGVGARALCGDASVMPAKGHVVVTANPGLRGCVVESDGNVFTHIFAMGPVCVLGGIHEPGNTDLMPDHAVTLDIIARAALIEPALKNVPVLAIRTGLRPERPAVRLEAETLPGGGIVIHNYGHGGAGYTLSQGCALDVVELAREIAQ